MNMPLLLFTGLSGAGKSTLAAALAALLQSSYNVEIIDGDHYRNTLNKDLGFSEADRRENIRRLVNVASQKSKAGIITIVAAINPFEDQRQQLVKEHGAQIVYIKCPMNILVERDTKGLYKRAMLPDEHPAKLHNLTGVNDRYDEPVKAALIIDTSAETIEAAAQRLYQLVKPQLSP